MTYQSLAITAAALSLLVGCASTSNDPSTLETASTFYGPNACTQGNIDEDRIFIVCQDGAGSAIDAMQAMNQPANPNLDIAAIAADYGVSPQGITGIEAATYSRIVGKTPEQRARSEESNGAFVTINGRDFRKISLSSEDREPVTLYIEA